MALASIAVYATPDNNRISVARRSFQSLAETVEWHKGNHRLFLIDNNSIDEMKKLLEEAKNWMPFTLITNDSNLGTARAVNKGWIHRLPGENCLKADEDVVWHQKNWLDILEECISRDDQIGVVGCKRKDCLESPRAPVRTWSHSQLEMLPQKAGQRWLSVEIVEHVMSTCALYSGKAIDKIGFLAQAGVYGCDDALMCVRLKCAGYYCCFYHHIEIDHIDEGNNPFQKWKQDYAGKRMKIFDKLRGQYKTGVRPLYQGPDDDLEKEFDAP